MRAATPWCRAIAWWDWSVSKISWWWTPATPSWCAGVIARRMCARSSRSSSDGDETIWSETEVSRDEKDPGFGDGARPLHCTRLREEGEKGERAGARGQAGRRGQRLAALPGPA